MPTLPDLLQQGAAHAWLFVPSAVLLGALHGLEPGHSKTMMAAFIIAIGGTVRQAVLLALCATLSHTLIVWVIALGGMSLGRGLTAATVEPYLQLASGVVVLALGGWIIRRTRREQALAAVRYGDDRVHHHHHHDHHHNGDEEVRELTGGYQDAHELAHANDIRRRFAGRDVTTAQVVIFGLTGGLIPCPGAITVLLLCLQLKQIALGAVLVLCFSIGLALTMVASGVLAALSVKHVSRRFSGFGEIVRRAPFLSGAVILLIGGYLAINGWLHLPAAA